MLQFLFHRRLQHRQCYHIQPNHIQPKHQLKNVLTSFRILSNVNSSILSVFSALIPPFWIIPAPVMKYHICVNLEFAVRVAVQKRKPVLTAIMAINAKTPPVPLELLQKHRHLVQYRPQSSHQQHFQYLQWTHL